MNTINVKHNISIYPIYDIPYLDITIDWIFLNELLDELFPNKWIKWLVPVFSDWLINQEDKKLIWNNILPTNWNITILPILICPDDQDFTCTTIVTKVINQWNIITWKGFWFSNSYNSWKYEFIDSNIERLDNNITFKYAIEEYKIIMKNLMILQN